MDPILFWTIAAGVFGLIVGSFLNVCIFRLPRNCMSISKPRSRCTRCLKLISWYDNIPVASWCVLGGKCRGCAKPISFRYPFVELMTGAFFAYAAWINMSMEGGATPIMRGALFGIQAYVVAAMIVSTFIDLDFQILPDEITISGILLGILLSAGIPEWHVVNGSGLSTGMMEAIDNAYLGGLASGALGAVVGGGVIYLVGVLGQLVFRKEAMGFGDVKYMAFLGAFLGWQSILLTFLLACLFGSIFGIGKYLLKRRMGYVPFGPFLSAGAVVMLFFATQIHWLMDQYLALFRPAA